LHSLVFWLILLTALLTAAGLCWRFLDPESAFHLLDHPNHRSLHQQAIPRSGGVAILLAIVLSLAVADITQVLSMEGLLLWLLAGVLMLSVVGLVDDYGHVSPLIRFATHFLAAGLLLLAGLDIAVLRLPGCSLPLPYWVALILETGFIVWMINLYNFMDGMDGFAGGMSVIGFGSLSLIGLSGGQTDFALVAGVIAAAAGGFLLWNFPPAKIFMGDAGAPVLGYLAAALSLWGMKLALFPLWIAVLLFSPFIVDASYTLLLRMLRGEKVWQAHREHIYQQLVQLGWGHKRTVLLAYGLMLGCAVSAGYLLQASATVQWLGLVVWLVIYVLIILAAGLLVKNRYSNQGRA
jgi:UDP-N-acetylmuramyl pentapeptide phosphotransferase/UDP-N-acetylglucosamine-1-phosphate transferase